jgi:hypothetical protein
LRSSYLVGIHTGDWLVSFYISPPPRRFYEDRRTRCARFFFFCCEQASLFKFKPFKFLLWLLLLSMEWSWRLLFLLLRFPRDENIVPFASLPQPVFGAALSCFFFCRSLCFVHGVVVVVVGVLVVVAAMFFVVVVSSKSFPKGALHWRERGYHVVLRAFFFHSCFCTWSRRRRRWCACCCCCYVFCRSPIPPKSFPKRALWDQYVRAFSFFLSRFCTWSRRRRRRWCACCCCCFFLS